jgi:geranylgeranyl reductase family protein
MTRGRVLVVGCGPAGAAAAVTCARAGLDVEVFDRARFPRPKTCGDALSPEAVEILGTLGAAEAVLGGAHARVRVARALFPDGGSVRRRLDPPGMIVSRLRLDEALRAAAVRSGATVREGHMVRSLIVEHGVTVGLRGDGFEARGDLVIAADGHGSVARDVLGHPKPSGRFLGVARTAYCEGIRFDAGPDIADHYFEHDLPLGYGWIFPEVDGRSNVGVYQRGDAFERSPGALDHALDAFIANHPERFSDAREVGRRRTWPLPLSPAPWNLSSRGLALVGDAANHIDPLSGEGIWQALRSGQLLGDAAAAVADDPVRLAGETIGRQYAERAEREIRKPARRRAWVQTGIQRLIDARVYRLRPVRWLLEWGYGQGELDSAANAR